jgi:hypothetical protein
LVYRYAETAACSISLPIKTPEKVATVNTFFLSIYIFEGFKTKQYSFLIKKNPMF